MHADGRIETMLLDSKTARVELDEAITAAKSSGLAWQDEPVMLTPQPKLIDLIIRSRDLQKLGKVDAAAQGT